MQILRLIAGLLLLPSALVAQGPRLWVLRAPGEMVEYDAKSFATKQTVKVPAEALKTPASLQVSRLRQMLFAPAVSLPLSEDDANEPHRVWIWNGHAPATIDQGLKRKVEDRGSNKEIAELLQIRESTVKYHVSNLFSKLQVTSRYELAQSQTSGMLEPLAQLI